MSHGVERLNLRFPTKHQGLRARTALICHHPLFDQTRIARSVLIVRITIADSVSLRSDAVIGNEAAVGLVTVFAVAATTAAAVVIG